MERKYLYRFLNFKFILKEGVNDNVSSFLDEINSKYEMSDELRNKIEDFIEKSGCQKIEFIRFNYPAFGLSMHDGVLINRMLLNTYGLEHLIFIIFHEIAHQYQFKKYGEEKMYDTYIGDISDDEATDFLRKTEIVADEFATRKIRELQKINLFNKSFVPPQQYKNMSKSTLKEMITNIRTSLKNQNIKSPKKISEFFYNMVKVKPMTFYT
jgi:hypothetical protein